MMKILILKLMVISLVFIASQTCFGQNVHKKLKEQFFTFYSKHEPNDMASLGFHEFDITWKDWSPGAIEEETAFYNTFLEILEDQMPKASVSEKLDLEAMKTVALFKRIFYTQQRHLSAIWVSKSQLTTLSNQSLRLGTTSDYGCIDKAQSWLTILTRIKSIPTFLKIQESNLSLGLRRGLAPNRYIYDIVLEDIHSNLDNNKLRADMLFYLCRG